MSEAAARRSPLHRVLEPAVAGLSERPFEGQLVLRGDAQDTAFRTGVRSATGLELPCTPNTLAADANARLAWLGPSEWLLTVAPGAEAALMSALESALAGQHVSVVDVSDGYTTIVLEDPDAAGILARDCPLDFHPRAFPVGSCAGSMLGKANALILREAERRFALVIRRSFAEYQWALLAHAADLSRRGG
jgi:sarcosine oxidase subunit gamma